MLYNAREIYDMLVTGATRDAIPATDQEIDLALMLFEDELTLEHCNLLFQETTIQ